MVDTNQYSPSSCRCNTCKATSFFTGDPFNQEGTFNADPFAGNDPFSDPFGGSSGGASGAKDAFSGEGDGDGFGSSGFDAFGNQKVVNLSMISM